MITVIFNLDGNPHEIIIKDTKYFVKELYGCEKHKNTIVTVNDITFKFYFSAGICLLELRLTYLMKNTFIEELKKYERKSLDIKLTKNCEGKQQCSINLRELINQVSQLKSRLATYRPLLSDDIIVAFESLL
ncbi:UNKNOWN [Stylonychia lemnae]|uniref:Uncharacterized protein n=1 Tax=Stylonychia lemnae TaxID=5949 RepID=A0A078AF78_STYLE|nr:UNKNOWN [Stylonychia lemnae]|eukprot:CDW79568.1 UNKNOWN [Stylonychia lemnae]